MGVPSITGNAMIDNCFSHDAYLIRQKFWKLFGAAFHIYDAQGNLVFYSKQKAFKLREDIRLYADESMRMELLTIQARNIIDFSASYDVTDPLTGEKVGALRRKGLRSLMRDQWLVLDPNDVEICVIEEDSLFKALVRRLIEFATIFMPQRYTGKVGDREVCRFRQNFNPFIKKVSLDFSADHDDLLDRRLGVAAAVLLCAIEGRQN